MRYVMARVRTQRGSHRPQERLRQPATLHSKTRRGPAKQVQQEHWRVPGRTREPSRAQNRERMKLRKKALQAARGVSQKSALAPADELARLPQ